MFMEAESCVSQGICSMRRKKKKSRLYFSSKKALKKSRMRTANKEFSFRGPNKLLDFKNANVVDIAIVTDGVLQAV
jgi:hypothetical protein